MTLEPMHSLIKNAPEAGFILDAGCNNLFHANTLKNGSRKIISLDIIKPERSLVQENLFTLGSIENLPYKNNTFDFIYCFSVIQFINNDRSVFEEFYRVLKPGGKLLITVPTRRSPFRIIREMEVNFALYEWAQYNVAYHHYYSFEDIKELTFNTFQIKSISGYKYNFIPRFLRLLIGMSKQKKVVSRLWKQKNKKSEKKQYALNRYHSNRYLAVNIFYEFAYHFIILLDKVESISKTSC